MEIFAILPYLPVFVHWEPSRYDEDLNKAILETKWSHQETALKLPPYWAPPTTQIYENEQTLSKFMKNNERLNFRGDLIPRRAQYGSNINTVY